MNAKQLIATVALFAATGAAFAQSTEYADPAAGFVSTKTRAEVVAEIKQASALGTLAQRDGQDATVTTTARSRADARAEAVQSAKSLRQLTDVNSTYFGG